MKEVFEQLIGTELAWHRLRGPYYGAMFQGKEARLRFHDFPDHPVVFTMLVGDEEQDWDDRGDIPENWTFIDEPRQMKEIFRQLIEAEIVWRRLPGPLYGAMFQGKEARFQFHDSPDDPVPFTLIIGAEEYDWGNDHLPKNWTFIRDEPQP